VRLHYKLGSLYAANTIVLLTTNMKLSVIIHQSTHTVQIFDQNGCFLCEFYEGLSDSIFYIHTPRAAFGRKLLRYL